MGSAYDVLVVGGGFFGLYLAEYLSKNGSSVVVCEKENDCMQRASFVNQARVHNGYHYPRSILTAFRSRVNFPRFNSEFPQCVNSEIEKIYAISRRFSKVSAQQFRTFCTRIGAPVKPAPKELRKLFDDNFIEDVFLTQEYVFDAVALKETMLARTRKVGVEIRLGTEVRELRQGGNETIQAEISSFQGAEEIRAGQVLNCTYSQINHSIHDSKLPVIPLKHEMTEMALVEVPKELQNLGITVMCGPFFSCMPFPSKGLHTLSHVRYTPHFEWHDTQSSCRNAHETMKQSDLNSAYPAMIRDAQRYIPVLADCRYRDSLWEVKTVLPRSEGDDSRPILFRPHHGLQNHHVIMGGKIDNVYDAVDELEQLLNFGTTAKQA